MTGIELLRKYAETRQAAATCRQLPDALGKECDDFGSCSDCHRFVCKAIADQIERETLPRPRFDDGEPVQFGDEFYCGNSQTTVGDTWNVKRMTFYSNGNTIVADNRFSSTMLAPCERLRRPEPPKVLDADGIEIKVGDEVWGVEDSEAPWTVESISGEHVTCVSNESKWHRYARCSTYTHKRPEPPDTWEQLAADIEDCDGSACDYFGRIKEEGRAPCSGCKAYNDETDCTVQVMLDLVRRAKKLAGVEE